VIRKQHSRDRVRAFTLVEILVVVITIGILAAVTLPNLVGATEEARATGVAASLKAIENAASQYEAEHGVYPVSAVGGPAIEAAFGGKLKAGKLSATPPCGGFWGWVNAGAWQYPYIRNNSATDAFPGIGQRLDEVIDDGVSNKGRVLHFKFGSTGYIFYLSRAI